MYLEYMKVYFFYGITGNNELFHNILIHREGAVYIVIPLLKKLNIMKKLIFFRN